MQNTFKIIKRSIHNQSYILLQNKYKKEIKDLYNKLKTLEIENKKLLEKNKHLEEELLFKNRFLNLNRYKLY
jgi:hypothetical protein